MTLPALQHIIRAAQALAGNKLFPRLRANFRDIFGV